jgi:type IV pilus assembly protein PilV
VVRAIVEIARKRDKGFTLIEVMVAMLILLISMMALLWALSIAVEHNLKNQMMDEAVRIAEDRMNTLRGAAFAGLSDGSAVVARSFRNFAVQFTVRWTVENLSTNNSRALRVVVTWNWKGMDHQHAITSIVSKDV